MWRDSKLQKQKKCPSIELKGISKVKSIFKTKTKIVTENKNPLHKVAYLRSSLKSVHPNESKLYIRKAEDTFNKTEAVDVDGIEPLFSKMSEETGIYLDYTFEDSASETDCDNNLGSLKEALEVALVSTRTEDDLEILRKFAGTRFIVGKRKASHKSQTGVTEIAQNHFKDDAEFKKVNEDITLPIILLKLTEDNPVKPEETEPVKIVDDFVERAGEDITYSDPCQDKKQEIKIDTVYEGISNKEEEKKIDEFEKPKKEPFEVEPPKHGVSVKFSLDKDDHVSKNVEDTSPVSDACTPEVKPPRKVRSRVSTRNIS